MSLSKFFTVELFPRFTAAGLIQTNKSHLPFAEGDVIIDWEPFDIPNCPVLLRDINVVIRGKDGAPQSNRDLVFGHISFNFLINSKPDPSSSLISITA